MAYTNGGQTIDKSMNGLLNFNGDTVTADDIICNTIDVNSSATFDGTATFNNNLPTSVITTASNNNQFITLGIGNALYGGSGLLVSNNVWTGTNAFNTNLPTSTLTGIPTSTQIAPVSMLDNLYQAIVTGGFARLTTVNNAFTNNNTFNTSLPSSTLTGTPTSTQIAPVSMLDNLYARLASNNFFTGINSFSGSSSFTAGLTASVVSTLFISWTIPSGDLCEQIFDALTGIFTSKIYGNGTTPRFNFGFMDGVYPNIEVIRFRIAQTISTFFTRVQITTTDIANTNTTALSLTNSNSVPTSLDMSLSWNSGVNAMLQAGDTAIIARTVVDSATTALTLAPWSNTTCGIRITKDDVTLRGLTNNFLASTSNITGATNFTSLPAMTSGITTVTVIDNLVTKRITDALYYGLVTGGYARLSTIDNTFTNNNTFGGTNTIINSTTTNINGTCVVKGAQTTSSIDLQMSVINSLAPNPNSINFGCNLNAGNYNPVVLSGDSAIFSGKNTNTSILVLTTHSTTACGIRMSATDVAIQGTVGLAGASTTVNSTSLAISASTATTFVNLPSTTAAFTTATANQFITKNIGDNLYAGKITGGYAGLTTTNNFTGNNTFSGSLVTFSGTSASISSTWTFTALPFINVDATGADLDEAMNWRTTIAQIGVGVTNLKAAINTWAASNTFTTFLTTNEPFNLVFNAIKTYGNQSLGFQKNNQNFQIANTGSINVYKNGAIMLIEQKWGVWLILFKISLNVAANCVIHIGMGTTTAVPLTETIVTNQTSVANADFCLQTSMIFQNTSITAPGQSIFGVVKSTVLNTLVNSVDIRFVRIG